MPRTLLIDPETVKNKIEEFRENSVWLEENLKNLQQKYPDVFVAVYKKDVVAHNKDYKMLINFLRKQYNNIDTIVIEFIHGTDYYLVL